MLFRHGSTYVPNRRTACSAACLACDKLQPVWESPHHASSADHACLARISYVFLFFHFSLCTYRPLFDKAHFRFAFDASRLKSSNSLPPRSQLQERADSFADVVSRYIHLMSNELSENRFWAEILLCGSSSCVLQSLCAGVTNR